MARAAREISQSGLYHIVFRGVNKQHIFEESTDYEKLIEVISNLKREMEFEIYAYCLMSNHVHILLKEKEPGEISRDSGDVRLCQNVIRIRLYFL